VNTTTVMFYSPDVNGLREKLVSIYSCLEADEKMFIFVAPNNENDLREFDLSLPAYLKDNILSIFLTSVLSSTESFNLFLNLIPTTSIVFFDAQKPTRWRGITSTITVKLKKLQFNKWKILSPRSDLNIVVDAVVSTKKIGNFEGVFGDKKTVLTKVRSQLETSKFWSSDGKVSMFLASDSLMKRDS